MTLCTDALKVICQFATGLRPSHKSECLDNYLVGEIDADTIASYIIHNNEYHDGWTYEQLGHLIRLMEARTEPTVTVPGQQIKKSITSVIESKIDEYNCRNMIIRHRAIKAAGGAPESPQFLQYPRDISARAFLGIDEDDNVSIKKETEFKKPQAPEEVKKVVALSQDKDAETLLRRSQRKRCSTIQLD